MKKLLHISLSFLVLVSFGSIAYASQLSQESARFETSLAAPIGTTDTSMTLVSGTNNDGTSLAGYVCFTIDSNQPNVEDVCGTANGIFVTGLTRGLSGSTGTTTVASLKSSHRRGADVKISDTPFLVILSRIMNQIDGFANPIAYDSSVATTTLAGNRQNVASVGFVQDTAFNSAGVINATTAAKGVAQIATGAQAAASTNLGSSGASLVLPSSIATSTFNTLTAGNKVIVSGTTGTIDQGFISLASTTIIGSTRAFDIGKHEIVITATSSPTTLIVPSGIITLHVRMVGAGGGVAPNGGSGAGAGGYEEADVNVSATSSIEVDVGAEGQGGNSTGQTAGGTTRFSSFMACTGGQPGSASGTGNFGGIGGTCTASSTVSAFMTQGSVGANTTTANFGGVGGSSLLGGSNQGGLLTTGYGAGASSGNGSVSFPKNYGATGAVIIDY